MLSCYRFGKGKPVDEVFRELFGSERPKGVTSIPADGQERLSQYA